MKSNTIDLPEAVLLREEDRELYHAFCQCFYKAFSGLPGRILLEQIWLIDDDAKTIQLRLPGSRSSVMVWMKEGAVLGAVAGCEYGRQEFSQVKHFGFASPFEGDKIFEVMSLFRDPDSARSRRIKADFIEKHCFPYLHENGYQRVIATCSDRVWPLYQRWGWELHGVREIEGFQRCFISKTV